MLKKEKEIVPVVRCEICSKMIPYDEIKRHRASHYRCGELKIPAKGGASV